MKKTLVLAFILILLVFCVGCGKKGKSNNESSEVFKEEENSITETSSFAEEVVSDSAVNQQANEMLESLDNTSWSAIDEYGTKYLAEIENSNIKLWLESEFGTFEFDEEFWINEAGKIDLENEELSAVLNNADIYYSLDGDNSTLQIGDVYLNRTTWTDYKEQLTNLDVVKDAMEYISAEHCWLACVDVRVVIMFFDGKEINMQYMYKDDEEIIKEKITANWSMNVEHLAFYDFAGKEIEDFTWRFEMEGDLKVFTISDAEDNEMTFYELEKNSFEEGEKLAESYLMNQKGIDDIEDLSHVLDGYEGVSIVDAFVAAGLNPSLSNRAVFAEEFEIENYRGTAEQNLFLLESMGGKIK